jgi:Fe-S-cluster-containing dehydrogenase component/CRP-like cAMP-binding protein
VTSGSVSIPPPQRWNAPFDESMTKVEVARVLAIEPFVSMDTASFPAPLTLDGIIRNDMRLRRFQPGEIVVRADDYGNSAFLVVRGEVRVMLPPGLPRDLLGRASPAKQSLAAGITQLWRNSRHPEVRDPTRYLSLTEQGAESEEAVGRFVETLEVFDEDGARVNAVDLGGLSEIWIGRSSDNDLVLDDSACSAQHAVIRRHGGETVVTDCESTNGTLVDGERVEKQRLEPGSTVQIGKHRICVQRHEADELAHVTAWPADGAAGHVQAGVVTDPGGTTRTFLRGVPGLLDDHKSAILGEGEIFGEIAALGRTPRTATVVAEGSMVLLEMRWQGLRDIRRRDEAFRRHVEKVYRERSLATHLTATPLFAHLSPEIIKIIIAETVFETYGEFDWHTSYKRFAAEPEAQRMGREPLIVEQGGYPDGLFLIRSGFARVAQNYHHGLRTLRYLGQGAMFGLEEILAGWDGETTVAYEHSLRAVGYADVLRVPTKVIEEHVMPGLSPERLREIRGAAGIPEKSTTRRARPVVSPDAQALGLSSSLVEGLVDQHFINGRAAMLINLERCVRCDACVQACAAGHDNNPRFNRHGRSLDTLMIANACMHCADPVCMIGCPTGAIHRASDAGEVVINDDTCIGCATCANSCPYDNIRMVEIRDRQGQFIVDEVSQAPVLKATKCDLCIDQPGGPACERACPYDALQRMDMGDLPKLAQWLNR